MAFKVKNTCDLPATLEITGSTRVVIAGEELLINHPLEFDLEAGDEIEFLGDEPVTASVNEGSDLD